MLKAMNRVLLATDEPEATSQQWQQLLDAEPAGRDVRPALGGMMLGLSRRRCAWTWFGHPEHVEVAP